MQNDTTSKSPIYASCGLMADRSYQAPSTSREAERAHTLSGRRRTNSAAVLAAVQQQPGGTADEIAYATDIDPVEVRRRLVDLHHNGDVRPGEARHGHRSGRRQLSWWARP